MFRFSLATFLLVVAVASVLIAGLAFPNELWERIIGTTTLVLFCAASLAVIAWQGVERWFWIGFAVVGWGYLAVAFYGENGARHVLLTTSALSQLDDALESSVPKLTPNGERVTIYNDKVQVAGDNRISVLTFQEAQQQGYWKYAYSRQTRPTSGNFHDIGHYAWAIVLACFGGMFSLWLYRRSKESTN